MKLRRKKGLLKQLSEIEDFRKHREQIVYPLHEILFLTIFGLLKGYVQKTVTLSHLKRFYLDT